MELVDGPVTRDVLSSRRKREQDNWNENVSKTSKRRASDGFGKRKRRREEERLSEGSIGSRTVSSRSFKSHISITSLRSVKSVRSIASLKSFTSLQSFKSLHTIRHSVAQALLTWRNRSSTLQAYNTDVIELMMNQRWSELLVYLTAVERMRDLFGDFDTLDDMGGNMLHIVSEFDPPLCILRKLDQINPSYTRQRDLEQQYPLHAAAAFGAAPEVIDFLVKRYPKAALMKNVDGKTPLHLACEKYSLEANAETDAFLKEKKKRELNDVVTSICESAPVSVIIENDNDITALEYVLIHTNDKKLMTFLQDMSVKVHCKLSQRMKENGGVNYLRNNFPMIDPSSL